ncbi:MAG TPA: hypothetical protein VFS49_09185 [Croceibacterium sp.]|nr:hypothetical protein [Croceibacterium sp.]
MRSTLPARFCAAALAAAGFISCPAAAAIEHVTLERGIDAIVIDGDIHDGDDARFRDLSRRYPRAVVYLESAGGALVPAIEIGKLVHANHHPTAVLDGSTCTSACALIWIAGAPRYLGADGRLGFHASYSDEGGRLVETGVGNAIVGHYLAQLDLSEEAAVFATIASPYEINWLTAANSGEADIPFEAAPPSLPRPQRRADSTPKALANPNVLQKAQAASRR